MLAGGEQKFVKNEWILACEGFCNAAQPIVES